MTEPRTFQTIGVVGLGTMGAGIAEVFARNGFSVIGVELNDDADGLEGAGLSHAAEPIERLASVHLSAMLITTRTPFTSRRRSRSFWRRRRSYGARSVTSVNPRLR